MEIGRHLEALRSDGGLLAAAAERSDLDTPIPTCPGWTMRDLIRHVGDVHRWAAAHVADRRTDPIGRDELIELAGPLPDDADLLAWFRDGHAGLVKTLEGADPDTVCWAFLPAPSPLAFWARRQAHETGIHRADAESPGGPGSISAFAADVAADGVDELLLGFLSRGGGDMDFESPRTLHLHATDTDGEWLVRIGESRVEASLRHDRADCDVRATASDLHLLLWNRRPVDGLEVHGDPSLLSFWRDAVQIRWSRDRS